MLQRRKFEATTIISGRRYVWKREERGRVWKEKMKNVAKRDKRVKRRCTASKETFVLHATRETPDGSPLPLFEVTTVTTATGRTAAKPPLMRLEPWRLLV
nr:hypothetical protein Iba_chr05fCG11240 [Ipomoea batatas]